MLVLRPEVGVGVEPEAVEAEGADSAPGLALAVVDGLDVSHGAHELDAPGGGDLPERRPGAVAVRLDFGHIVYDRTRLRRERSCLFFWPRVRLGVFRFGGDERLSDGSERVAALG